MTIRVNLSRRYKNYEHMGTSHQNIYEAKTERIQGEKFIFEQNFWRC